ncbi:peptidoglycan DD-metalloendopeptidase family protein [Amnibacterium endophyticum]|uniref:Peptidoglycan DD-metalloendopeptidase family protein n=1 Tax=Amnibacterium endophyticum TaxID=2109337 RepID=A0ABW4LID4_9MICO
MRSILGALVAAGLLLGGGAATAAEPRWAWPVDDHRVLRGFEAPATPYAAGHRGVDLAVAPSERVRAPDDGVVAFAGPVAGRPVLSIDHAGVRSTLEPVASDLRVGDVVRRGQDVGTLAAGSTHAAGVLHLGARVRVGAGWAYVSPLLHLGGAHRAVLLPLAAFPG